MHTYAFFSCNPFRIRTSKKHRGWGPIHSNSKPATRHSPLGTLLKFFLFTSLRTLLRFFALRKNSTLLFSISSALFAENIRGGGGVQLLSPQASPRTKGIRSNQRLPLFIFHESRDTGHGSPVTYTATLFHPWLANASANTSSPISTGAKRSRALFAFRRIPQCSSRATINIAGSKSVRDTVK